MYRNICSCYNIVIQAKGMTELDYSRSWNEEVGIVNASGTYDDAPTAMGRV